MGSGIGRRTALTLSWLALVPSFAQADSTILTRGATQTSPQELRGNDTLEIEAGAELATGDTAITLEGASPAPGVAIDNSGTITSDDRGIDTDGDDTERSISLSNRDGAIISSQDDTFRVDSDVTLGMVGVDNAGSLLSADGQVLDFKSIESPDAVVDIDNAEDGVIASQSDDAIRPGAGTITIDNAGKILSTDSPSRAINVSEYTRLESFHLTNEATGIIESTDDAVRIDSEDDEQSSAAGAVTIDNYGLILSSGTGDDAGQAVDLDHIVSDLGEVTIHNYAGGEIRAEDADGVRPGEGATLINSGTIIANGSEPDSSNDGVDLQAHSATIDNREGGLISGARHGITTDVDVTVYNAVGATIRGRNGSGVGSDGDGMVVNRGLISGDIDEESALADGDGVDIDYIGDITNYGTIQGTGAKGQKPGDTPNRSEGIAMGGGSIINASADAVIRGADNGILIDDGSSGGAYGETAIVNRGTIEGVNGYGISMVGNYADSVVNSGLIAGGNGLALAMGAGDDTLVVETGGTFQGTVDGGDGQDSITLDGSGEFVGGVNFETLTVSGDWLLSGTQRYTDGITLTDMSHLDLDGTLDGALAVGTGALLDGNGTTGDLTVAGTVSPGHSLGQLNVNEDYLQTESSTYAAEIGGGGSADLIAIDGSATLAGALTLTPLSDAAYTTSSYTLLTATDGISGRYDEPAAFSPFFDLALNDGDDAVVLDVTRNATSFADMAATGNQRAAAAGIESLGAGNALYDEIITTADPSMLQRDYDALSGELHTSLHAGLIEESGYTRDALIGRLRQVDTAKDDRHGGIWVHAFGGWADSDGNGNAATLERSTRGLFIGADGDLGMAWRAGVAAGYARTDDDIEARDSHADIDTYTLAAYAGRRFGSGEPKTVEASDARRAPLALRFGIA